MTTRGLTLVTLAQGGTLRIGAGSTISVNRPMQLSLKDGLIYVDMPPGSTASNLSITTRAGAIEHIGTEYEVMSGRPLEFADDRARQVADSTILHGSVRGQEPLGALTHVLASTSLAYELCGDSIWVHSDT